MLYDPRPWLHLPQTACRQRGDGVFSTWFGSRTALLKVGFCSILRKHQIISFWNMNSFNRESDTRTVLGTWECSWALPQAEGGTELGEVLHLKWTVALLPLVYDSKKFESGFLLRKKKGKSFIRQFLRWWQSNKYDVQILVVLLSASLGYALTNALHLVRLRAASTCPAPQRKHAQIHRKHPPPHQTLWHFVVFFAKAIRRIALLWNSLGSSRCG